MFSKYRHPRNVATICLAIVATDGSSRWWRPEFYRYPELFARRLSVAAVAGGPEFLRVTLWCAAEILRLIRLERGSTAGIAAIRMVDRTPRGDHFDERILAEVPVGKL